MYGIESTDEALAEAIPILSPEVSFPACSVVINFFEENNIEKLDWPLQSPVGIQWSISILFGIKKSQSNHEKTFRYFGKKMRAISQIIVKSLALSMLNRLKEVILNKSGATKY